MSNQTNISINMELPLQNLGSNNKILPLTLINLSHEANTAMRDTLSLTERGMTTVDTQNEWLKIDTNPPASIEQAIETASNTIRVTQNTATKRNLVISDTADVPHKTNVAKAVISLHADHEGLAERQARILQGLQDSAQIILSNRSNPDTIESDPSYTVKHAGKLTQVTVDSSSQLIETAVLLNAAVGTDEDCQRTENLLGSLPKEVNKISALLSANRSEIATLIPEKIHNLDMIVTGQRASLSPSLMAYSA